MTKKLKIDSHQIHIDDDVETLIANLTLLIHDAAKAKQALGQHYYISLGGGTTPKRLYQALASDQRFSTDLWQSFEIYLGDERYVPHTSADSNYQMIKQAWLDQVPIPASQIHPIPTHCEDVDRCARDYADVVNAIPKLNALPCFDLILLGMGDDGHTASLFPDTPVLEETQKLVAAVYVAKLDSQRITSTYPLINNAKQVLVLVTGQNKAAMLKRVFYEKQAKLPIQRIRNRHGVLWFLDSAAATELVA